MPADGARRRPAHPRPVLPVLAGLLTVALFALAVLGTGFVACGVSGCGGGGFGPAYAPTRAQVGLLAAGLTLVPLAVWACRNRRPLLRAAAGAGAVVVGATLTMLVVGLGPDGCPRGQERAVTGPSAFEPGAATCSGDPDALPSR